MGKVLMRNKKLYNGLCVLMIFEMSIKTHKTSQFDDKCLVKEN